MLRTVYRKDHMYDQILKDNFYVTKHWAYMFEDNNMKVCSVQISDDFTKINDVVTIEIWTCVTQ